MKLLNKKQKNNKGFSLVELIVVIAIMVVLVAVLAPVFTKYIESSRRSTDVQNANSIAEGVLADVADNRVSDWGTKTGSVTLGQKTYDTYKAKSGIPTAIKDVIKTKGNPVGSGLEFTFCYDEATNKAHVFVNDDTTYDLTDETQATNYKNYND